MIEHMSVGAWPVNSIDDINRARKMLQEAGHESADFTLVVNYVALNFLSHQITNTAHSFLDWMKDHDLLFDVILDSDLPIDVVYVFATRRNFPILRSLEGVKWWEGCLKMLKADSVVQIKGINGSW